MPRFVVLTNLDLDLHLHLDLDLHLEIEKKNHTRQLRVHQAALGALGRRRAPAGQLSVAGDWPGTLLPASVGGALFLRAKRIEREKEKSKKTN